MKQPPRRTPDAFAGKDIAALQKLQRQGVIQPCTSPWASSIVLVWKKDSTSCPTTDFRVLYHHVKNDAFLIPHTEACRGAAVASATLFSTMNTTSAYHQSPIKEDIPKTAFTTKYGLFEYATMPFSLSNATACFHRVTQWNSVVYSGRPAL